MRKDEIEKGRKKDWRKDEVEKVRKKEALGKRRNS